MPVEEDNSTRPTTRRSTSIGRWGRRWKLPRAAAAVAKAIFQRSNRLVLIKWDEIGRLFYWKKKKKKFFLISGPKMTPRNAVKNVIKDYFYLFIFKFFKIQVDSKAIKAFLLSSRTNANEWVDQWRVERLKVWAPSLQVELSDLRPEPVEWRSEHKNLMVRRVRRDAERKKKNRN